MAEGLPVVAAAVGGVPELVEDGHSGFLVPPGEVSALRGRLELLVRDVALRNRLGQAARDRVCLKFSSHRMVEQIAAIYDSLLAPATMY
jgi:glycosyltransferase involved in cell wall biosynthesis